MRAVLQQIPWLLLALLAYYLPWIWHKAAALTFNAYDLAEWVGIHPAVRNGNPPMLAPFFLRVLLGMLAWLLALQSLRYDRLPQVVRWLYMVLVFALAITLLPPLEFFRGAFNDVNYQQQIALSIVTLIGIGVILLLRKRIGKWQTRIEVSVAALSIFAALVGVGMAYNTIQSVQVYPTIGGGAVLFVASLVGGILSLTPYRLRA